jgi:hypothetical protein
MAKISSSENPVFNPEMEAMERTTPAHYTEWNNRHEQLLNNDQYLKNQVDATGFCVEDGMLCVEIEED